MIIDFRQGVVDYDISQDFLVHQSGNKVRLNVGTRPTIVTVAHGNYDYLFEEPVAINGAWEGIISSVAQKYWLYWDFNAKTFARTFGFTTLEPIAQATTPASSMTDADNIPALTEGRHWYDTNDHRHYVYTTGFWREVIRVFAGMFHNGTFYSLSIDAPFFSGTQIGSVVANRHAGRVVYDVNSEPIKRTDGTFLTTEDKFFVAGSEVDAIRLESNVHWALSGATSITSKYSVVAYDQNGRVQPAVYDDTGNTVVGMLTTNTHYLEAGPVVLQGVITNPEWNWSTVGQPLWISPDQPGSLITSDPHLTNPVTYPVGRVPVARVLTPTTIIFEQGLGGKGDKGPPGSLANLPLATHSNAGVVYLSMGPSDPRTTAVVINTDPRLTDARSPLPHSHAAVEITFVPSSNIISTNVQAAIEEVDSKKVSIDGDEMEGPLYLYNDPTQGNEAVTKNYVDALVSGLVWLDPICDVNLIADNVADPSSLTPQYTDGYIVPPGALGVWSTLVGHYVAWDGTAWTDHGAIPWADPIGIRIGIAMTSSATPSGSFAGHKNHIAIFDDTGTLTGFEIPASNNAVYVCGDSSLNAYNQYVFDQDDNHWVLFGGYQTVEAGINLYKTGTVMNVLDFSSGGTIDAKYWQGLEPSDLDSVYAPITHQHTISEVVNLQNVIDSKADAVHTHAHSDLTGLGADDHPQYHDDTRGDIRYYQKTEVDTLLTGKSDVGHIHNIPYDISYFIAGNMVPDDMVGSYLAARNITIPAGSSGLARCEVPIVTGNPTVIYPLNKNGVEVGTITFIPEQEIGVVSFPASVSMVPGDRLQIVTPSTVDLDLKNLTITVVGCAVANNCTP